MKPLPPFVPGNKKKVNINKITRIAAIVLAFVSVFFFFIKLLFL